METAKKRSGLLSVVTKPTLRFLTCMVLVMALILFSGLRTLMLSRKARIQTSKWNQSTLGTHYHMETLFNVLKI